ncbi:MAG: cobaltochelatase subunit CobN [Bacteroidales bacterium]|nr:cobaltochelatase subunit CobN [Bacteroidales bacterium]
MNFNKLFKSRRTWLIVAALVLSVASFTAWQRWAATTRVAFVNFMPIQMGHISKANDAAMIDIDVLSSEDIAKVSNYDMVFINGMGLRITEEQRAALIAAAEDGLPILATMVTNPANKVISVDSVAANALLSYLGNGGRENYRNMLYYVRRYVDGKTLFAPEPSAVLEHVSSLLYHADPNNPEAEDRGFSGVGQYQAWLHKQGLWKEQGAAVIVTGIMGEARDLVTALEKQGHNVYHVDNLPRFIAKQHIDSVKPQAIINMAHGRMGDDIVAYLQAANIPFFAPINVQSEVDKWEANKQGLWGGYMSQTVAMPETDGALMPYAVFAHYKDSEGLLQVAAMPDRIDNFVETVGRYINLRSKPNKEKRIAVFYLKGPGQSALAAQGLEVVPSLFNFLKRLQTEGYNVGTLPATAAELEARIQREGAILSSYDAGMMQSYMQRAKPEYITAEQYESWVKQSLRPERYKELVATSGSFPGTLMATDDGRLGLPRLQFGNVVLMPQMPAGVGGDEFKIAHGADAPPPHIYMAGYLWAQHAFKADALIHFGTHGSLEFTPDKQVALSSLDWSDRLVGTLPHFYIYTIGNVGESIIAKRRSYAQLVSYITPPFMESGLRGTYRELTQKLNVYNALALNTTVHDDVNGTTNNTRSNSAIDQASLAVKAATIALGFHRYLELDSNLLVPYSDDDIARIEAFAEELANEKITGELYVYGQAYAPARIHSTVVAMATDPIAYSLLALDKQAQRVPADFERRQQQFTNKYLLPARQLVERLIANPTAATDALICQTAKLTPAELARARAIDEALRQPAGGAMAAMMARMQAGGGGNRMVSGVKPTHGKNANGTTKDKSHSHMAMAKALGLEMPKHVKEKLAQRQKQGDTATSNNGHATTRRAAAGNPSTNHSALMAATRNTTATRPTGMAGMMGKGADTLKAEEKLWAMTVMEVERTIKNVARYKQQLQQSPELELRALINALNGGYTAPSPGGDAIAHPNALPTGRNMYALNAEATPTEAAWAKGKQLAQNTIDLYRRRHNDSLPRKVSYSFWSSEFIETEGATFAQAMYMLGVEPVRDAMGRVHDLRLIPSKELGRPRIDVVVQTSGQLRDLAASRLFLLQRAVEMAANAKDDSYTNQVAEGVVESERKLTERGLSPKAARELAKRRIFGGINGNYGTGIQEMTMASDRWKDEQEIANVYLNNMGAYYGHQDTWEEFQQHAFEAALTRTDVVIQPRQNNTWGALSLDHVFEFMGGLNLTVRNVTGKDPDAYMSDYRNRNNVRIQEVKEQIGVEARTTIFNPNYIREQMKQGGSSAASGFEEIVRNTFGWEVMKPTAIDEEFWNEIYDTYILDKHQLGVNQWIEEKSFTALQEITAIMLEAARKGMWQASDAQVKTLADQHTTLVNKHGVGGAEFTTDNAALREFIAEKAEASAAQKYTENIKKHREGDAKDGKVLKKETLSDTATTTKLVSTIAIVAIAIGLIVGVVILVRRRRRQG